MIKLKMRDMPVINIHIEPSDKQELEREAKKRGLRLIPYCRMILLDSFKRTNTNETK